jgi:hypothetical protein
MYFKKLVGKKCYLSPIDENDAEKFTGWLNDLELTINLQIYNGVFNVENERELLRNLSKEQNYSIIDLKNVTIQPGLYIFSHKLREFAVKKQV